MPVWREHHDPEREVLDLEPDRYRARAVHLSGEPQLAVVPPHLARGLEPKLDTTKRRLNFIRVTRVRPINGLNRIGVCDSHCRKTRNALQCTVKVG